MDDKELLIALGECDPAALSALFQQYGRYAAAVAAKTSTGFLTAEDVEEITADVFIRIWKLAEARQLTLKGENLKGYIGKSARNGALDLLRKKSCRIFTENGDGQLPVSAVISAEEEWLLAEELRSLLDRIEDLPERDREICLRRYFKGEKIKEIGQALGMEESAVSVRLARLRKRLKETWEREEAL